MKKLFALMISVLFSVTMLSGCSSDSDSAYRNRPTKITFCYFGGGYGDEWVDAVAKDFMDNVDTDIYVEVKKSSDAAQAQSAILSGVGTADLYQIEVGMFDFSEHLLDISDVYEMNVWGEEEKVKDKIGEERVEYYNQNGKWFQIPQTLMNGFNWTYNKTLLDSVFPEGYTIPRTTDELFWFGDQCVQKGIYLTAGALNDTQGGDYLNYMFNLWFAQMTGIDGYEKFFSGLIWDEATKTWVLSEDRPKVIEDNRVAIEQAYAVAQKLCSVEGDHVYLHRNSTSMNYKDVDCVYFGGKFHRQEVEKFAMLVTGNWLEMEVAPFIEEGAAFDQEIRAVKPPVISKITERCKDIKDDTTLRAVVDYVDGVTQTKPNVCDEDIGIVREARNMVVDNICRTFVVPKVAKNPDAVKKFLTYLVSDRAQMISAQNANGVSMLPYGYEPTEEDMGFEFSEYLKSCQALKQDAVYVDSNMINNLFRTTTQLNWYYDSYTFGKPLASGFIVGESKDWTEIYEATYNYFNNTWRTLISNYKSAAGLN